MRLGYLTASFPYGAGETFLIPEIGALRELGVEVFVLPLYPRGPLRADWDAEREGVKVAAANPWSPGVTVTALRVAARRPARLRGAAAPILQGPLGHLAKNLAVMPKALWLAKAIETSRCDHLHVHWGGTSASAGMIAATMVGIPWSLTLHRWDIYENNLLGLKSRSAAFLRFISERGRADAVSLGAHRPRTHVIPLGTSVPPAFAPPSWPGASGPFVLLCPANLIDVKGHRYLLDACGGLIEEGLDLQLLLAGDGPLRAALEHQASISALRDRVTFLGQLPRDDLLRLYQERRVHLTVLASIDLGGGVHEGVPVSLMEAMAHGVPVVATRTGSIPELVPDEFQVTAAHQDAAALATVLRGLLTEQRRYEAIARMCYERVRDEWDVTTSAKRLLALMLESSPSR